MAVLLNNDFIFFHIPKTGGKFIDQILINNKLYICRIGHRHSNYDHINPIINKKYIRFLQKNDRHIDIKLNHPLKFFCTIRDPITWYESWFKYNLKNNLASGKEEGNYLNWHILSPLTECNNENFNRYMYCINKTHPGFVTYLFRSYIINTKIYIIRFENLIEDLEKFFVINKFNLNFEDLKNTPPINVSDNMNIVWDEKIKRETIKNEIYYINLFYKEIYL